MHEAIRVLIKSRDVCVLSTVWEGEPHCSLMSYVTDETCREFYMITLTGTKKYRNLEVNRAVSLLIDSREDNEGGHREGIRALTVGGVFRPLEDPGEEARVRRRLLERHPHLRPFADSGQAKVFAVRARTFQLLEGVSRSHFETAE
jgi:nitroimidazol reductase NimA-like FMN-containing flavoprotein (pyridoxamine 5'-phosphate oxidase superfamily)